jgi:hypothetical protein
MSDEHTVHDSDYEVVLNRAFASSCTVTDHATGHTRTLYEQDRSKPVDVRPNGHPRKHRIVLRGRNGRKRNITITIDDPEHAIHGLKLDLYREGRDPSREGDDDAAESFSVLNHAVTCPPICDG